MKNTNIQLEENGGGAEMPLLLYGAELVKGT
jgi:hypothetical protein